MQALIHTLRVSLALLLAASTSEARATTYETITILSSRGGAKLIAEVKPVPTGPVQINITITDPLGNQRTLPPSKVQPDANGRINGPALPTECQGFLLKVQVIDPATGALLAVNWGIVG
jgi:hypothetical protein